jgi:hypothetical protein
VQATEMTPEDIAAKYSISLDGDELEEGSEFLAEITTDTFTRSAPKGSDELQDQWYLVVRPIDIPLKAENKVGGWPFWAKATRSNRSKLGVMVKAMGSALYPGDKDDPAVKAARASVQIGLGKLVGQRFWFVRRDEMDLGRMSDGTMMTAKSLLIATRKAEGDDLTRGGSPSIAASTNEHKVTEIEYDAESLSLICAFIDGKKPAEFQRAVLKSDEGKLLPKAVREAIISGAALKEVKARGLVEVDTDGTIKVPVAF